ncbi:MAG: AAA family ATPase [Candidatus Sumerlaeota bacterium]|nr:AAA family ATPase [Candidatus Sumerlaeota bacterium]
MYEQFFGLTEAPFNLTPDSRFLYLSQQHHEAMAALLFGVQERKGFMCLTGEVGSGKTILCRALLNELRARQVRTAIIFNSFLSDVELLRTINDELGIASHFDAKKELIDRLNRFLIEQNHTGGSVVLVIDEAQNLPTATLEQIRMLGNLESETAKLLQIVLVGQPQLNDTLAREDMRQLNDRISVRYHIGPLPEDEILPYIRHRLSVAGAKADIDFTDKAVAKIAGFTGGIPRKVNVLCDRCLLIAYVASTLSIDGAIVQQAISEIGAPPATKPGAPPWTRVAAERAAQYAPIVGRSGIYAALAAAVFCIAVSAWVALRNPAPAPEAPPTKAREVAGATPMPKPTMSALERLRLEGKNRKTEAEASKTGENGPAESAKAKKPAPGVNLATPAIQMAKATATAIAQAAASAWTASPVRTVLQGWVASPSTVVASSSVATPAAAKPLATPAPAIAQEASEETVVAAAAAKAEAGPELVPADGGVADLPAPTAAEPAASPAGKPALLAAAAAEPTATPEKERPREIPTLRNMSPLKQAPPKTTPIVAQATPQETPRETLAAAEPRSNDGVRPPEDTLAKNAAAAPNAPDAAKSPADESSNLNKSTKSTKSAESIPSIPSDESTKSEGSMVISPSLKPTPLPPPPMASASVAASVRLVSAKLESGAPRASWVYDENRIVRVADPGLALAASVLTVARTWNLLIDLSTFQQASADQLRRLDIFSVVSRQLGLEYCDLGRDLSAAFRFDLPMILALRPREPGESPYQVARSLDQGRLALADPLRGLRSAPLTEIAPRLQGVLILYRDPDRLKDLRMGDEGARVRRLQEFLASGRWLAVEPSGVFDDATAEALGRFQEVYGIPQTGQLDDWTSLLAASRRAPERPRLRTK